MFRAVVVLFMSITLLFSCQEDVLPKPKAMLRLDYPKGNYSQYGTEGCQYKFKINNLAEAKTLDDCSMVINYPFMNGSIFITYNKVNDNLERLMLDAEKLTYEHLSKADRIAPKEFANEEGKVYGLYIEVSGNAASQSQFFATDSTDHFITGSLYFNAKPNYDSILPAASYLQKDIVKIMESLEWVQN